MNTLDIKLAGWAAIEGAIVGMRRNTYAALLHYGPCTTAELAARSGMSILTLRPRVTELFQLGLARLADVQEKQSEGRYEAVGMMDAKTEYEKATVSGQMDLRITA